MQQIAADATDAREAGNKQPLGDLLGDVFRRRQHAQNGGIGAAAPHGANPFALVVYEDPWKKI